MKLWKLRCCARFHYKFWDQVTWLKHLDKLLDFIVHSMIIQIPDTKRSETKDLRSSVLWWQTESQPLTAPLFGTANDYTKATLNSWVIETAELWNKLISAVCDPSTVWRSRAKKRMMKRRVAVTFNRSLIKAYAGRQNSVDLLKIHVDGVVTTIALARFLTNWLNFWRIQFSKRSQFEWTRKRETDFASKALPIVWVNHFQSDTEWIILCHHKTL